MNKKLGILLILLALTALLLALSFLLRPSPTAPIAPGPTTPPPSAPGATPTAAPTPLPVVAQPQLPPLASPSLEGLDTQRKPWGQGLQVNEQNQPLAAVAYQGKYSEYGALFLAPQGETPTVYLTFDFGYETGYSGPILDTLAEKEAKASFFVVGSYARNQTETIQRMLAEGHTLGSHSATHKDMTTLTLEEARAEIADFNREFHQLYGQTPQFFRFPEGVYSQQLLALAASEGMYSTFWSYAYVDWGQDDQPDPETALQGALDAAHPGAIYLLHPMATNSAILGQLIDGLRQKGYEVAPL